MILQRLHPLFEYFCIVLSCFLCGVASKCLVRDPPGVTSPPQHNDAGFQLSINEQPEFYEERNLYTITLKGDKTPFLTKQFTEFILVVESSSNSGSGGLLGNHDSFQPPISSNSVHISNNTTFSSRSSLLSKSASSSQRTGKFQLLGDVLTRFSDHCTNTVTQTSSVAKSEIQVLWRAPPASSGCVTFKATVVENQYTWAMDTGRLSLTLCEAVVEEHSQPEEVTEPCCACEEAKYEVTFEGLWSELTHPRQFPSSKWLLHFSDIIGASHSADYRVWEYGGYASKGLEQVAKWGSPRALESELKSQSLHIRTIIKARGLWFPNHNGKTFAVFRTDRKNHLVSLVSMLGPSPDWIVGVSGLELCRANCSWVESKELFLYPWDSGVDSGISYESPDSPSEPKMPITRITSRYPDDPRQPFWNETGAPMKPLAKLTINRQRLYTKACGDEKAPFERTLYDDQQISDFENPIDEDSDHSLEPDCTTGAWTQWTKCSVTCGKGISMRQRVYSNPMKAKMAACGRQMVQKEMCSAKMKLCDGNRFYSSAPDGFLPDDMCGTSEWSRWSKCSTTCGKGFMSRTRRFYNRMGRKKCPHVETLEKQMCSGEASVCPSQGLEGKNPNSGDLMDNIAPHCAVTSWSEWSPCSVTCGKGIKVRTRLYKVSPQQRETNEACNLTLMQKTDCDGLRIECAFTAEEAKYICGLDKEMGQCRGFMPRWHFNSKTRMCLQFIYTGCRGNSNNFETYEDCMKVCDSPLESFRAPKNQFGRRKSGGFSSSMHHKKKWMSPITNRKRGQYSSFVSDSSSESSINNQIKLSLQKMNSLNSTIINHQNSNEQGPTTSKKYLRVKMQNDDNITLDRSFEEQDDEVTTDRNMDLIKRRMMLMQIDMSSRYGSNVNGQNGGFGSGTLPLMPGKSSRPNVFETREERRRRLLDLERSKQMAEMKLRMMSQGSTTAEPLVDCLVTAWSPWSECSATCESRIRQPSSSSRQNIPTREKFRMIKRYDSGGGRKCPKRLRRRQKCPVPSCEEDCGLGEWGEWSECSQSCGQDGVQERLRNVQNQPGVGGRPCGPRKESRMCTLADCPQPPN